MTRDETLMMEIRDRAMRLAKQYQAKGVDGMRLMLDLMAVHEKTPLKLRELAEAHDVDFTHDVWGIMRHLNRKTGELEDGFFPRFAKANDAPVMR